MLSCREQNALLHQACGIADTSDVLSASLNCEIVEVRTPENDSRIGGSGDEAHMAKNSGVQTNTLSSYFPLNRRLVHPNQFSKLTARELPFCALFSMAYTTCLVFKESRCGNHATFAELSVASKLTFTFEP